MSSTISTNCFLHSLYNVSISLHPNTFGNKSLPSVLKRNSNVTIIKNKNKLDNPIYLHNNMYSSVSSNTTNGKTTTTKPVFSKPFSKPEQNTNPTITDDTTYAPFSARSVNQPTNQPINQPIKQPVKETVKESVKESTKQLIDMTPTDLPSIDKPSTNKPTINTKEDLYEKPIHYFPWNDGIDYADACKNLLNALSNNTGPIIVSKGYNGGIGHKYLSLFYHVTYALLLHRNLYCKFFSFLSL